MRRSSRAITLAIPSEVINTRGVSWGPSSARCLTSNSTDRSPIFAHNHPSGVAEPSNADEMLTTALKQALALVDVRVLDHMIVAGAAVLSFAERGLL